MAQSLTSDDIKALVTFPFEDPNWKNKFLIGSLIAFVGYITLIPFLAVYGYTAQIIRRMVVDDSDPFLPEWDDFGQLFSDGFKLFVAGLIYALPLLLLFILAYGALFSSIFAAAFAAETVNQTSSSFIPVIPLLGSAIFFVLLGLAMIGGLAFGVVLPAMTTHVIVTEEIGAALRWREWWAIFRGNWGGFLLAYILQMALWVLVSLTLQMLYLTIIGCCFIPFLLPGVLFYTSVVIAPLFAQAYRQGVENNSPASTEAAPSP